MAKNFTDMTPEERRARLLEKRGEAYVEHADKVTLLGERNMVSGREEFWATCAEHGEISSRSVSLPWRTENVRRHLNGLS